MLEAARVLGRLPDSYFQAVGSGTGAIGAFEASLRLLEEDRFRGQALPRLHLSQNAPFLPIYDAWKNRAPIDPAAHQAGDGEIYAGVLANRTPPYAIRGGVADALAATGGAMYAVDTPEAQEAWREFRNIEGIDLEPAAAVAVASLKQAVAAGRVDSGQWILLNLTGGGFERLRTAFHLRHVPPTMVVDPDNLKVADSLF